MVRLLLASLLGCLVALPAGAAEHGEPLGPEQAIRLAQEHPHAGAEGRFRMRVAATGAVRFEQYLNSTPDYRDPDCLTVVIKRGALRGMRKAFGGEPKDVFQGREIIVEGTVHRTQIWLRGDGDTRPYYYQTHVDVTSPRQVTLLD